MCFFHSSFDCWNFCTKTEYYMDGKETKQSLNRSIVYY